MVKKLVVLAAALLLLFHSHAGAQEREPLAMRIMVDWTAAGALGGAAAGLILWLTDPGRPDNNLGDQLAVGSAWGAIGGVAFSLYIVNTFSNVPRSTVLTPGPLHPSRRITGDPVAALDKGQDLLGASAGAWGRGPVLLLPLVKFRF